MTTIGRNVVNPTGPSDGGERVMRGSSWYYTKTDMYASYRTKSNPVDIYFDVGFRCAKGANP
jgi:formylglycine-generating enzyme required for sulfatase activity